MKPEYSLGIVIPVYNVEKYLKECLESVVNQTVSFDEVILVNDGSSDGSQQICEQYGKAYPHVQLVNQENQGLGAARNCGMSLLKCDYIIFLDSDDYISLRTVETIKRRLNDHDILFYASEIFEDMEGVVHSNPYLRKESLCNQMMSGLDFFNRSFLDNYIVSACMAVYKKDFLEKYNIRFPEGVYYEDNCFYIENMIHAKRVESLTEQLYVRRYRAGSIMTSNISRKKCMDKMYVQFKIWNDIRANPSIEWRENILCKYLLRNASDTIWMIEQCEETNDIKVQETLFCGKFIEGWGKICKNNLALLHEYNILLKMYKKAGESNGTECGEIRKQFIEKLKRKLESLPLKNEKLKVGIYGIGNHTKAMLRLYEKYVGKINCNYIYIVSDILQSGVNLEDKKQRIVSYKNIPGDVGAIIISSLIHMDDMVRNLKNVGIETEKICLLYSSEEFFDLVRAEEFIENEIENIIVKNNRHG